MRSSPLIMTSSLLNSQNTSPLALNCMMPQPSVHAPCPDRCNCWISYDKLHDIEYIVYTCVLIIFQWTSEICKINTKFEKVYLLIFTSS